MKTTRHKIRGLIEKAIEQLQVAKQLPRFALPLVEAERPRERGHGDYATNVALQIAKLLGKRPTELAASLKTELQVLRPRFLEKVEVAEPGFINFFLSPLYLQRQVETILKQGEKFGNLNLGRQKKIQLEFISANPTGPLTVGNARGGPFGDTLGNVLARAGFRVSKSYYVNDYGQQILALGHSVLKDEEAQYRGDYIDYLHRKIKVKDPYKAGERAAHLIAKEMIKKTTDRLEIEYDEWLWESSFHRSGAVDRVLKRLEKKGLIQRKEGALWLTSSKLGDERDRVLVKKDGWKTYLAGDIALHQYYLDQKKVARVIQVWGADHHGDVPGLQAALEALGHKGKLEVILLQFVTLLEKGKGLKMSKRKGVFVTMDELLEKAGLDPVRFFFLQKSADTHLNFDLSLAKEQSEKNPVYYVQYANARIHSILANLKLKTKNSKPQLKTQNLRLLDHPSELNLIKQLIRFPEVIEDTARDYQVQRLPQYATDLAVAFHQFYRDCKVLTENSSLSAARTGLILATKTVLKNTLELMGISAPEKM